MNIIFGLTALGLCACRHGGTKAKIEAPPAPASAVIVSSGAATPEAATSEASPAGRPVVERIDELGSGFRFVVFTTRAQASSGRAGRLNCLYLEKRWIANVANCSASPSGNRAIYQESATGRLILYRREDDKKIALTDQFFAWAKSFEWNESRNAVAAHYGEQGADKFTWGE